MTPAPRPHRRDAALPGGGARRRVVFLHLALLAAFPPSAPAQVNIERQRQGDGERGLSASVSVDFALRSGNVDIVELGFGGRLDQVSHAFTVLVLAGADVGFQGGDRFSNQGIGHVRVVLLDPNRAVRPEAFAQVDYDRARALSLRTVGGGGLRVAIVRNTTVGLHFGTGYMLEHERLDLPPDAAHPDRTTRHRWTSYVAARLAVADWAGLTSTTYVQPAFEDSGDARILSDTRLAVELAAGVSVVNSLNVRYDSAPPDDTEGLDLTLRSGVRLAF